MKNIFIAGASGAIGSACCKAFLDKGYRVTATYNKGDDRASELMAYAPEGLLKFVKADITSSEDVMRAFSEGIEFMGDIDTVVNCAGISFSGIIQDTDDKTLSRLVDINIKGAFYVCREAIGHMIGNQSGSIVNISSMWGEVGASCEVAYSMTKSAIIGLTKALAKEVGPSGIRVNCVTPGLIESKMNSCYTSEELATIVEETPLMRMGIGDDVAKAVLYLADSTSSFVTGQILGVNGGYVI